MKIVAKCERKDFFTQNYAILNANYDVDNWWTAKSIIQDLEKRGDEIVISNDDKKAMLQVDLRKLQEQLQMVADELNYNGYKEQSNQIKLMENMVQYIRQYANKQ